MGSDNLRRKGVRAPNGNYDLSFLSADRAADGATASERLGHVGNSSAVTTGSGMVGLDSNSQNSQSPIIKEIRTFAIER